MKQYLMCLVLVFGSVSSSSTYADEENGVSYFVTTQQIKHFVYDHGRQVIYATVPSNATGQFANSLVTIDPQTGNVIDSIFVGNNPNRLAISDNNYRVYIGVDGERAFRWWQPGDGSLGPLRSLLSPGAFPDPAIAENLAVSPRRSNVVVIAKDEVGTSGDGDLEVFDDLTSEEPTSSSFFRSANTFGFASHSTLVTCNNSNSSAGMQCLILDNLTLLSKQSTSNGGGFNAEVEVVDGRAYDSTGEVLRTDTLEEIGVLSWAGLYNNHTLVAPVPALNRAYMVGPQRQGDDIDLITFDTNSFQEIDRVSLSGIEMEDERDADFIPVGTNRLAFSVRQSFSFTSPRELVIVSGVPVAIDSNVEMSPHSLQVTKGDLVSGADFELAFSDDSDVSIRRAADDTEAQVQLVVESASPQQIPAVLRIEVEASVFARKQVTQTIELFNFDTNNWEAIDTRPASRFVDGTTLVSISGNRQRFVETDSFIVRARIGYESSSSRLRFTANIDNVLFLMR